MGLKKKISQDLGMSNRIPCLALSLTTFQAIFLLPKVSNKFEGPSPYLGRNKHFQPWARKPQGVEEPGPGPQNPRVPDPILQLTAHLTFAESQRFHDVDVHLQNERGGLLNKLQESFRFWNSGGRWLHETYGFIEHLLYAIQYYCFHARYLIQHSQLRHYPQFSDEETEGRKNSPLSKVPD